MNTKSHGLRVTLETVCLLFPILLLSGCNCLTNGDDGSCVDFEDLTVGVEYAIGDTFSDSGVQMEVQEFSATVPSGHVEVKGSLQAGGSGNDLWCSNANVAFAFEPVSSIELKFADYGGSEQLEVNGDLVSVQQIHTLDGTTLGGVAISATVLISTVSYKRGVLKLSGDIQSFKIGGQELVIDDICAE